MRIFYEETLCRGIPKEVMVAFERKETERLIEMLKAACKAHPRKLTWRKIYDDFQTKACCF